MTLLSARDCRRIVKLFALIGSDNQAESNNARDKLAQLLAKLRLSWNDLPELLTAARDDARPTSRPSPAPAATDPPSVNVLELVLYLLEEHVGVSDEQRMAIALWILHTYVFDRFTVTPRLALLSPVRECGKTTLIELIELLVAEAFRTDNVTPAPIYHTLANRRVVMLIDEADNLGLLRDPVLRAVFNSGHRRGGSVARLVDGRVRKFPTFGPLCVAAIGDVLPLPLLGRSVTIRMQRYSPDEARPQLKRLDPSDPALSGARDQLWKWAATCSLAQDPEMPAGFRNRIKDNWAPLISAADHLGHGEAARAAASVLRRSAGLDNEDAAVVLLDNIRTVFVTRGIDRIASAVLVKALVEEIVDTPWVEWRGSRDDRQPHKLTEAELASLLRPFQIKPRTIWPTRRHRETTSARGYLRAWFEEAWRRYCRSDDEQPVYRVLRSA
jgi:hypothetical protein